MPDIFDYQRHTGTLERYDYDPNTGEMYINRAQDLSLWRKHTMEARNARLGKPIGPDKDVHLAYSIPVTVEVELLKKGIRVGTSDPAMNKRLIQELEANYPQCKMSDKKLWIPRGRNER